MKLEQHIHGDIKQLINADNFYAGDSKISSEDKTLLEKELNEIKNEPSKKVKESKLEKFIKKWAGTISEIATPFIKEIIFPK